MGAEAAKLDEAVHAVMGFGRIPQGFTGTIDVSDAAVRAWMAEGAPLNAWWFAFVAAVVSQYRQRAAIVRTEFDLNAGRVVL